MLSLSDVAIAIAQIKMFENFLTVLLLDPDLTKIGAWTWRARKSLRITKFETKVATFKF